MLLFCIKQHFNGRGGGVDAEYIPSTTCEEKTVHEYYFNSELGVNIEEKSCEVKNSNEGDKGVFDKILDSAVLVGIITALFSLMQHNNTNSLKYITEERQKWREKIRDIAKSIEVYQYSSDDEDKQKLKEILVELKVNINPYGKGNDTAYMEDGHIWAVIRNLEKPQEISNDQNQLNEQKPRDENEFFEDKNKLIGYLSCLLKYDWERAKYEVEQKSLWIRGLKVYGVWMALIIWIGILFASFNIENIIYRGILYFIIIFIIFLLYLKKINFEINKWKNKFKIIKKICIGIICFFITIISIQYYDIFASNMDKPILFNLKSCLEKNCIENIFLIIAVSIYLIIIYSSYIEDKKGYKTIQKEYIKYIENINNIDTTTPK